MIKNIFKLGLVALCVCGCSTPECACHAPKSVVEQDTAHEIKRVSLDTYYLKPCKSAGEIQKEESVGGDDHGDYVTGLVNELEACRVRHLALSGVFGD